MPSIAELLAFYQNYVDHHLGADLRGDEPSRFENPEPDPKFTFKSDKYKGKDLEPRRFASLHKMMREDPTIEPQLKSALGQLYDALVDQGAGFQGPWEVEEFMEGFQPIMPEDRSELRRIEAILGEPAPHWKFTIPVFQAKNALSTTRGTDSDEGNWLLGDLGEGSVPARTSTYSHGHRRLFPATCRSWN
jgi:hypothetical protein